MAPPPHSPFAPPPPLPPPFHRQSPGCGVFLEFKHYKPKKQKVSTKCFSVLELDELKNGTFPLEV